MREGKRGRVREEKRERGREGGKEGGKEGERVARLGYIIAPLSRTYHCLGHVRCPLEVHPGGVLADLGCEGGDGGGVQGC